MQSFVHTSHPARVIFCFGTLPRALPRIVADPADREARSDALHGAWLCGTCLGAAGMALHQALRPAGSGALIPRYP